MWSSYFNSGYNFYTLIYEDDKSIMNSSICVSGICVQNTSGDFYGLLEKII